MKGKKRILKVAKQRNLKTPNNGGMGGVKHERERKREIKHERYRVGQNWETKLSVAATM